MATVVELQPSLEALATYLKVPVTAVKVEPYWFDERIGWDTHIVTVDGSPFGFTNGPVAS